MTVKTNKALKIGCSQNTVIVTLALVFFLGFSPVEGVASSAVREALRLPLLSEPLSPLGTRARDLYGNRFAYSEPLDEFDWDDKTESKNTGKRSTLKAVALSALLPGGGQLYLGAKGQARLFLGMEASVWLSYAGLSVYADWKGNDVMRFAVSHAGIDPEGKDDTYFRNLTFYSDLEEYNTLGRAFSPDFPYIPDTPQWSWSWDSDESQSRYRELRNETSRAERNAEFMFVAAGVNRLISMVFAWREARRQNRTDLADDDFDGELSQRKSSPGAQTTFQLLVPPPGHGASDGLMLTFLRTF